MTEDAAGDAERPDFKCESCGKKLKFKKAKALFESVLAKTEASVGATDSKALEQCEQFLKDYSSVLHPSNMFMVRVKYGLCSMYGRVKGYEFESLAEKGLQRKKQLCEEVLPILNKIEQGISPRKGKK